MWNGAAFENITCHPVSAWRAFGQGRGLSAIALQNRRPNAHRRRRAMSASNRCVFVVSSLAGIVLKLPRVSAPAKASAATRDAKCLGAGANGRRVENAGRAEPSAWWRVRVAVRGKPGPWVNPLRWLHCKQYRRIGAHAKIAMAHRCERDRAEKKPYQWFTLLICVVRSAYFSKAAQPASISVSIAASGPMRMRSSSRAAP